MPPSSPTATNPIVGALEHIGERSIGLFEFVGGLAWLGWDVLAWTFRSLVRRTVRFGTTAFVAQVVRVGVRSVPIVCLVSGSIGLILALQTAPSLAQFGQTDKVANLVAVAVFRELGPLIAAIVLTGFAGASIAAEIGTMVVGEEIEALEAMALNPVRFLVMPRVLAATMSLILLTAIADVTAVTAGGAMGVFALDISYETYRDNTIEQLKQADFLTGLVKAGVFGLLLGLIACRNGLRVEGGAAGVGKATTDTVVQTIIVVVLADLLFTSLFYATGWT
ncbi:MAG: ABC transporter permease [Phycisphaerae bacterium]|nr:ABC transporter permease [Phycisphaerae bacterium]